MSPRQLRFTLRAGTCVLYALLAGAPLAADESGSTSAVPPQRPRIGLVLSGGGAKGGAHVGVIKVLEEQRVPIDCIAGTSMGALIGGGYAAGLPAAEIEQFVNGIDWEAVLGGVERRPLEPVEQKRTKTRTGANFELGIKNRRVVAPAGLSNTSGIDDLLRTYVARARMFADFDQLPIPYRAVATDMVSGKMVVLERGDLAMAMRASMAIPGAFAPVAWDKYVLADGGQVRNIPVDVARETCADVVIVVNLVEPETPPEKLVQATQLLARSMEVMLEANEQVQLATLTNADVRIDVPMGDIGAVDFPRVAEAVPLGEAAARQVAGALARYSVPPAQYAAWRQGVTMRQGLEARVAEVRYEGLQQVNPEYLRSVTTIRPGDAVSIAAISHDALRMAALDDVASVAYRIEGDPANPVLVWMPEETSVGHDVLRPSMGLYAAGEGDLKFLVGGQYVRRWLNGRGGQWRSTVQLGHETLLATSLYQPFDVAQHWFVEPGLSASRSFENVYVDGEHVAEYEFRDAGGRVELGVNLTPASQLRLGYLNTARRSYVRTGVADLPQIHRRVPEIDARDAGLAASVTHDSRDVATFARHGLAAELQYVHADESLGGDRDWSRIEAGVRKGVPFGKNAVWLGVAGGADLSADQIPGDRAFSLGGPQTLPAYDHDELRVRGYWLANVNVLWNLADLVPIRNQIIYGGFGVQAAGLYDRVDRVEDGEVYAISLNVGGPTPIGTFTLGVGSATDSWGVWLAIGRPVGKGSILDDGLFR